MHAMIPAILLLGVHDFPTGQVREVFTGKACAFVRGVFDAVIRIGSR